MSDEVRVEAGQVWRRRRDGKLYRVHWILRGDRCQMVRADATNLKRTHWIDAWNLPIRYELVPERGGDDA